MGLNAAQRGIRKINSPYPMLRGSLPNRTSRICASEIADSNLCKARVSLASPGVDSVYVGLVDSSPPPLAWSALPTP